MAKLQAPLTAGWNAGQNYYAKTLRVKDVHTDDEIAKLFVYNEKVFDEIVQDMAANGYDKSQPVTVWKREDGVYVVVDGHTRLAAAKAAGLEEIPVAELPFEDKEEAILYTLRRQVIRRNLTGGEILTAIQIIGRRRAQYGKGREVETLAQRLGVSPAQVSRAKKILAEAPEEEIEAIRRGEKKIGEVHKALTNPKREPELPDYDDEETGTAATAGDHKPGAEAIASVKAELNMLVSRLEYTKATVTLLAEAGETKAARLVVNHFYRKNEREAFFSMLPEAIGESLSRDNNWPTVAR